MLLKQRNLSEMIASKLFKFKGNRINSLHCSLFSRNPGSISKWKLVTVPWLICKLSSEFFTWLSWALWWRGSYFGYKPPSVMSQAVTVGSFRLADTNHGSFRPFPCSSLVVGVLSEQQNIIWFCYEDTWQGWQFNSVLGVSENKTVLSRISHAMFSVYCLLNSDKTWRAGNSE